MEHSYVREIRFRNIRMALHVYLKETWRTNVLFYTPYCEAVEFEQDGFTNYMDALNSLGAYVDELCEGTRLITRLRVARAMEKLTRDVLKGEAQ